MKRSPWAGHAELFLSGSQRKPLKKKAEVGLGPVHCFTVVITGRWGSEN